MTPVGARPAEVHVARLGLVEREPVSTETFAQHVKQPLAAVAVFEGDDKIVGESHKLAVSAQARPRHFLEPIIQHVVQEDVGEHRRDHVRNRGAGFMVRPQTRSNSSHCPDSYQ